MGLCACNRGNRVLMEVRCIRRAIAIIRSCICEGEANICRCASGRMCCGPLSNEAVEQCWTGLQARRTTNNPRDAKGRSSRADGEENSSKKKREAEARVEDEKQRSRWEVCPAGLVYQARNKTVQQEPRRRQCGKGILISPYSSHIHPTCTHRVQIVQLRTEGLKADGRGLLGRSTLHTASAGLPQGLDAATNTESVEMRGR